MRPGLVARLLLATGFLALVVGAAFAVLLVALDHERESSELVQESQDVLVAANRLERLVIDLETGERGFLITGEDRFLEPWQSARGSLPEATAELERRTLVPVQQARAKRITAAISAYLQDYSIPLVEGARRQESSARSVTRTEEGKRRVDELRTEFDRLVATERALNESRQDRAASAIRLAIVAAVSGLVGSILLISLFGVYLTRAIVLPVRRASAMAGRLAGGDFAVRMPETGVGEIGVLERSFNTMGRSLETSREALRVLAEQQAALRRVATLVARGVSPTEVFDAVTTEVGRLLRADSTRLLRYQADATCTVVAAHSTGDVAIPVGTRLTLEGEHVAALVLHSGRPAVMDQGPGSAVGAPVIVEGRLWGVIVAAWTDQVAVSDEDEARMTEFTELVATAIANADSRAELTASRARVVAAADEARRRIERDLHDGIQQRLVSLGLEVRAAEAGVPARPEELKAQLAHVAGGLARVAEELQELSRGIHPAILAKGGLGPALKTLARRSPVPVELDVHAAGRLPEPVEVAAYYVVSEALTNAAKHAHASVVEVSVASQDSVLRISISDDGVGGADPARGSGLIGLRDRVEALGGRIEVLSAGGSGTSVVATIPLPSG